MKFNFNFNFNFWIYSRNWARAIEFLNDLKTLKKTSNLKKTAILLHWRQTNWP